jgi:hypothetical protein
MVTLAWWQRHGEARRRRDETRQHGVKQRRLMRF